MLRRCGYRGEKHAHPNYAGRVTVCEAWQTSFAQFVRDMGPRPSMDHTIDRIDGSSHYEPANCRWATRREQTHNTSANVRITHNDRTMIVADWARETGIAGDTITRRLGRGWSVEDALTLAEGKRPVTRDVPARPRPPRVTIGPEGIDLLTPAEAAVELKTDRRRVYTLALSLPCVRVGSGPKAPIRISRADLPTYAEHIAKEVQS